MLSTYYAEIQFNQEAVAVSINENLLAVPQVNTVKNKRYILVNNARMRSIGILVFIHRFPKHWCP